MAQTPEQQRTSHPLGAYAFRVVVDAQTLSFAKVSGLHREHHTLVYQHGLSFLEGQGIARYHFDKFIDVTLERGTVVGGRFLRDWLEEKKLRAMEISLVDGAGKPVIAWRVARAVPVKLTAPTFDASSNEVAVEVLELKAAGITIVHL